MPVSLLRFLVLWMILQASFCSYAQLPTNAITPIKKTRILFIFDFSFSMYSKWGSDTRIEVAKNVMTQFLESIKNTPNLDIALRCYGHQFDFSPVQHCEDTKLEVPFGPALTQAKTIQEKIARLQPKGTTPIAHSLGECAQDFPPMTEEVQNVVILITDGVEECNGDPCAVSLTLQEKNIFIRPYVIGIGLDLKMADSFACIGKYFHVSHHSLFRSVLQLIFTEATTRTTAQVNLNNQQGKPNETDVTFSISNENNGQMMYHYLHTLNHRGLPDTIILNPDIPYAIKVHTLPPVYKEHIQLEKGKHNTIAIDCPQGFLKIDINGNSMLKSIPILIRQEGQSQTLNVQDIGQSGKYLIGKYEAEVLTLPRIKIKDIDIKQSSTHVVKIQPSGQVHINKGGPAYGSIYVLDGNQMIWVCNLSDDIINENIYLQPGNYRVTLRFKTQLESEKTIQRDFTIQSNQLINLSFL